MTGHAPQELACSWPAVPASVGEARAAVARFAAAMGAGAAALAAIRLAVSEAVTNAVLHAYVDDERPGSVRVTAGQDESGLWVSVADDGRGMVPRSDSPGSGLGLPLIAQMAAGLQIERGDGGGTTLLMHFEPAG